MLVFNNHRYWSSSCLFEDEKEDEDPERWFRTAFVEALVGSEGSLGEAGIEGEGEKEEKFGAQGPDIHGEREREGDLAHSVSEHEESGVHLEAREERTHTRGLSQPLIFLL